MATELFRVPTEEAAKPDFTLTNEQLTSYNPSAWFTSTEMLDTVPSLEDWPTEDDLQILTDGIPISQLPLLGRWPNGPMTGGSGVTGTTVARESFGPSPGA